MDPTKQILTELEALKIRAWKLGTWEGVRVGNLLAGIVNAAERGDLESYSKYSSSYTGSLADDFDFSAIEEAGDVWTN